MHTLFFHSHNWGALLKDAIITAQIVKGDTTLIMLEESGLNEVVGSAAGAFLGVIAGIAITIIVHRIITKREEKQKVSNLKTETEYNISKIEDLKVKADHFRQAIAEDTLHQFYDDFDVSKVFKVTMGQMVASGQIHNCLTREQIKNIFANFDNFFSMGTENFIREKVNGFRQALSEAMAQAGTGALEIYRTTTKQHALSFHRFINDKLCQNKEELEAIKNALEQIVNR